MKPKLAIGLNVTLNHALNLFHGAFQGLRFQSLFFRASDTSLE
jgi:hypothetical protein